MFCVGEGGYLVCADGKDAFKEQHEGSEMVIWSEIGDEVEGVLVTR